MIKPMLFNTDMVRAILEGRKTVTRRAAKPQPKGGHTVLDYDDEAHTADILCGNGGEGGVFRDWAETVKAPCWTGDILWVRETWAKSMAGTFMYQADNKAIMVERWRPSIHMPREAARIFLKVTDVRVERLQEIDGLGSFDEGAVAPMPKGCLPPQKPDGYDGWSEGKRNDWLRSMARATYISKLEFQNRLIKAFRNTWDSTIKLKDLPTYGWVADPWVWVIEFERCEKPRGFV